MENKNMRKLNVTVQCMAVYNSSIMVPRELTFEEAIKYAKEHIDEINLGELEYISDSDELDEENCDFDEEEDTDSDCSITKNMCRSIRGGGFMTSTPMKGFLGLP